MADIVNPRSSRCCLSLQTVLLLVLLAAETLLFMDEQFRFFVGQVKGLAVLTGCALMIASLLCFVIWFGVRLILRRPFRIGFGSTALLLSCAAITFGWLVHDIRRAERQRENVAWLRSDPTCSDTVTYGYELSGEAKSSPNFLLRISALRDFFGQDLFADVDTVFWSRGDTGLDRVIEFRNLRQFGSVNSKITDEGLKTLSALKDLEELRLPFNQSITDEGLRYLANFSQLKDVNLNYVSHIPDVYLSQPELPFEAFQRAKLLSDAGIANLKPNNHLERFSIVDAKISDVGVRQIVQKFPNLQTLNLSGTQVTDNGAEALCALKYLTVLDVSSTAITDKGLAFIATLSHLPNLNLSYTSITDVGMQSVAKLSKLDCLVVDHTKITDAGMMQLVRLNRLTDVSVNGTKVTDEGEKAFAAERPGCEIHREEDKMQRDDDK